MLEETVQKPKLPPRSKVIAEKEVVQDIIEVIPEPVIEEQVETQLFQDTVTINGINYGVTRKFNVTFDSLDSSLLPTITELNSIIAQLKPNKGVYWSSSYFVNSPLKYIHCLLFNGTSIEQPSHKYCNAYLLTKV